MLNHIQKYYIKYIVSFIVGIGIICMANALANQWTLLINYLNGSFVAGLVLVCIGGLSWCGNKGAYDMASHLFAKRGPNGVKPSLYDYSEQKRTKRIENKLGFVPYMIVGAVFVIISLILFIFM